MTETGNTASPHYDARFLLYRRTAHRSAPQWKFCGCLFAALHPVRSHVQNRCWRRPQYLQAADKHRQQHHGCSSLHECVAFWQMSPFSGLRLA